MSTDRTTINSFAVCNADMGNDVLDDNNNSSSNEQRTQHDDNDRGDDIIINDAPFEWLTNFQSLMHLVSPSRIVFGESSLDSSTSLKNGISSKLYSHQHHPSLSTSNGIIKLNALHVGCGTSTCGEEMLDIQECLATNTSDSVSSNNNMNNKADVQQRREVVYHLQYGHVVNVDVDKDALEVMERRWTTTQHIMKSKKQLKERKMEVRRIEWRYLDFNDESSCRSALDPIYEAATTAAATTDRPNNKEVSGGYFDLVFDKSTLDCLLCSETDVVAGFLCEVYRALRVPSICSSTATDLDGTPSCCHENSAGDTTASSSIPSSWGGIYVLISFHPVDFIEQILTQLPGAEWDVVHEVVKRRVGSIGKAGKDGGVTDNEAVDGNNDHDGSNLHVEEVVATKSHFAWSSGTFQPDDNYRKTVNVFTCRRKRNTPTSPYILDRELVRRYIEKCCNDWYQTTNPMVTVQREGQLRLDFLNATRNGPSPHSTKNEDGAVLDLKQCYSILFTEAEKEHLTYEYFIEDWEAYCKRRESQKDALSREGMTVDIALDFLREMQ